MGTMSLRVMYWPNEPAHLYPGFTQAGGRAAFEAMAADGTIGALDIYSQRVERAKFASLEAFEDAARARIAAFAPDILFVQHLQDTDMRAAFWRRLRDEHPRVTVVFHDDDAYDPFAKRIDGATAAIAAAADLVLLSGLGRLSRLFQRNGARAVGYMPSCFMGERFGRLDPAVAKKTTNVVMIGSHGRRARLRFLYLPGGRRRAQFVRRMSNTFGDGFTLYGGGWDGFVPSHGVLPYFEQEQAIQRARFTANWDHYDKLAYYFSDRLPISLATGVPHVTTWHVGYDQIFAGCPGFYPCRTVDEAVDTCLWLSSRSDEELLEQGLGARRWVFENMEANVVFKRALEQAITAHLARQ